MQVFHLVSNLDSTSIAGPIGLLGRQLAAPITQRVVCLGAPGMPSRQQPGRTQQPGCSRIDFLNWTRAIDPAPLRRLRRLLQAEPPDLIQAWGMAALRCLGLVGRRWLPRTLFTDPHTSRRSELGRLDRWLLARVCAIVASSHAEADAYGRAGLPEATVIRPGVLPPLPFGERGRGEGRSLGAIPHEPHSTNFPADSVQRILCLGDPRVRSSFRDAIWAFDMLHCVFVQSRMAIAADTTVRPYLDWFAERLEIAGYVDFLEEDADLAQPTAQADVCWAPSAQGVTQQAVLEAMAAGRPVIAADQPALREIVAEQETGYLTPEGDKVTLCQRTRGLFLNPELTRHMGDAARRRAAAEFSAEAYARNWSEQYAKAA